MRGRICFTDKKLHKWNYVLYAVCTYIPYLYIVIGINWEWHNSGNNWSISRVESSNFTANKIVVANFQHQNYQLCFQRNISICQNEHLSLSITYIHLYRSKQQALLHGTIFLSPPQIRKLKKLLNLSIDSVQILRQRELKK